MTALLHFSINLVTGAVKRGEGIPYENTNDGLMKTEISSKLYQVI